MNTSKLQQVKIAWLAAEERGDKQGQFALLRDHPDIQSALVDFIAAYRATDVTQQDVALAQDIPLLPLTQRACQTAFGRVFGKEQVAITVTVAASTLRELRALRSLSLVQAAKGLQLGVDVWKKFEDGAIDLLSLSQRQLERFAGFFQVSADQFGSLLDNSQPALVLNRRQTGEAARSGQQSAKKQSFDEAIQKSAMPADQKQVWLEQ
ncbi:MAG: helix-turn-helix transcriptional regulator [Ktedonobacteraceae bacterium]|nr:helix-turn-helix transcriptional regulator [Chloroflexota bacterium]